MVSVNSCQLHLGSNIDHFINTFLQLSAKGIARLYITSIEGMLKLLILSLDIWHSKISRIELKISNWNFRYIKNSNSRYLKLNLGYLELNVRHLLLNSRYLIEIQISEIQFEMFWIEFEIAEIEFEISQTEFKTYLKFNSRYLKLALNVNSACHMTSRINI